MWTDQNLFSFATSELSQDAFICWLASWATPELREVDRPLHTTATAFLDRLLEVGNGPKVSDYRSIEVHRQWNKIDVLLLVNGETAIIIEDKTDTKDHSDQLRRYKKRVEEEFHDHQIAAVYLKTGDQCDYENIKQGGYGCFLRRDFLDVLDRGEKAGVKNDIFADFHRYLRAVEPAVQSFRTVPLGEWNKDWNRWKGFFMVLKPLLDKSDWKYVANQTGGFMGFTWHWRDDKFLQLENNKLCFKITVPDKAKQTAKWREWHLALMAKNGTGGIMLQRPARRQDGTWMTVAYLEGDFRQGDLEGRLDLDRTLDTLKRAEALMDSALG